MVDLPKFGLLGWIQFIINCVIVIVGFCLIYFVGGALAAADPRLTLQFFGIGIALVGLGWSLLSSQFNSLTLTEMKQIISDLKK